MLTCPVTRNALVSVYASNSPQRRNRSGQGTVHVPPKNPDAAAERQRLPSRRSSRRQHARVRLPDDAEMRLDVRDELLHDRVAIGAVVGRVDGVGVVEVGRGVLEGHHDHPRERRAIPVLVERVSALPMVSDRRCHDVGRLGCTVGREAEGRAQREMSLRVENGILRRRMLVVAFRQEHDGSQIHRMTPELGQDVALDLDVFDPLRVGGHRDRRQNPIEPRWTSYPVAGSRCRRWTALTRLPGARVKC